MTAQTPGEHKPTASPWHVLFALAAGCAVLALAVPNRLTFPYPANDEARFFLPSWNFARTGSLNPPILNAPNGLYWVPDGFYVWMGALLALFGRTIQVARTICEVTVALGISVLVLALRRILDSAWMLAAIACTLVAPPVIYAANMVRMESILCLLFALALWLHLHQAHNAAAAVLLLSLLFHPAFCIALPAYLLALWATRDGASDRLHWQPLIGRLLLSAVLLAFTLEVARILPHLALVRQHMAYQAMRKSSMGHWALLKKPQGIVWMAEICAALILAAARRRMGLSLRDNLLPVFAATLGMQTYAVLGGEGAYDIYSLSIGPAIFLATGCAWAPKSLGGSALCTE